MHLIPGKYFENENEELTVPWKFKLPLWDYIKMNLNAQKRGEKELIDLFDITPTALKLWKTGKREISQDKLVVLCNMFGVTIDQMLERDFSDDYMMEDFYGLSKFNGKTEPKEFTESDLRFLFEELNHAMACMEYFALGYIPHEFIDIDDDEFPDNLDEYYISCDETEYYCKSFDIDVTYDVSSNEKVSVKSIRYSELCKIADLLTSLWGDKSYEHIIAKPDQKYDVMLLKSGNAKALIDHLKQFKNKTDDLFKLWQMLKEKVQNYDKDCVMGKVLLADGACLVKDNKKDLEGTLELFRQIALLDIKKI